MSDASPDASAQRTPQDDFAPRDYPIADQIARQRKTWKHERIGFALLLAFVALALSGLFSGGPLSERSASSPGQRLTVHYERFLRSGAGSRLILTARTRPSATATLRLDPAFLHAYTIEHLQPQPLAARSQAGGLELVGRADGQGELSFYLTIRPERLGPVHGTAWFEGDSVAFPQFIYP